MRIIVTHTSPDLDAITSVWLIKKFLPGWEGAEVRFVPAGERISSSKFNPSTSLRARVQSSKLEDTIEKKGEDEVIHVDTGLGPLDHHQTASDKVSAASLTFDFVKRTQNSELRTQNSENKKWEDRMAAVDRMVRVVVDMDHFKEVFWEDATADYHEFDLGSILDGLKLAKPNQDEYYMQFVIECLDAILHEFENRIWAEKEIKENGIEFVTRFGKGMGFETINDSVLKLAQKMGYVVVVRKDPRKGYVRVKARPSQVQSSKFNPSTSSGLTLSGVERVKVQCSDIDLTLAYEKLRKMDPTATWFLHIGKKMLLNGSVKNPKMRPTKLGLGEIIKVLEKI